MNILGKILGGIVYLILAVITIYMEWAYLTSPGFRDPKHHSYTFIGAAVIVLPLAAITLIAWVRGRRNAASAPAAPARTYSRTTW